MKNQAENNPFRKITKMYHDPRNSTKILIHPTQILLRIKLLNINQKLNQSDLRKHMTISTLCKILMRILILLIQKNKTWKMMRINNKNYLRDKFKRSLKYKRIISYNNLEKIYGIPF